MRAVFRWYHLGIGLKGQTAHRKMSQTHMEIPLNLVWRKMQNKHKDAPKTSSQEPHCQYSGIFRVCLKTWTRTPKLEVLLSSFFLGGARPLLSHPNSSIRKLPLNQLKTTKHQAKEAAGLSHPHRPRGFRLQGWQRLAGAQLPRQSPDLAVRAKSLRNESKLGFILFPC